MSYDAKVFNVMISSPGDVEAERSIIREVLYEWNSVHSISRKIVLLPLAWETHTSPEMGAHPQKIINHQILDKGDILVGVFWTRLGTPTNEYVSGTVEEIELHMKAKKPTMLYFSSQPVALNSVDIKNFEELSKFKETCKQRGLFQEYDSLSDFKEKIYRHLQLKLNEEPYFLDLKSESITEIIQSKVKIPLLTNEALLLLREASLDRNGNILFLRYIGGNSLQANGKNLIQSKEPREIAKWEGALNELLDKNLIIDRGHKREIFQITNFGYELADTIQQGRQV